MPEDEICKKDSENIRVVQNDICSTARCVKMLMESGASASSNPHSFNMEDGINLNFQINFIGWQETNILIKFISCKMRTNFAILES